MEINEPLSFVQDSEQMGPKTHPANFLKRADEFLATEPYGPRGSAKNMTDPSIFSAPVKDSAIAIYKVSGVSENPTTIFAPVKPRYTHITNIHKKLRKYSKRIGKRQALKWAMFSGNKLFSRTN